MSEHQQTSISHERDRLLSPAEVAAYVERQRLGLKAFWAEAAGGDQVPLLLSTVRALCDRLD